MKHDAPCYTCRTEFDDSSIRLMFKTEYFTYEKKPLAGRIAFAVVMLLVGMFAGLPLPAQALCLLVGVWLLVALDFPSKIRAEGVIQNRGGAASHVNVTFTGIDIRVENQPHLPYNQVDALADTGAYFILFQNRQNAVMVQKSTLEPAQPEEFRKFIEEKTGKTFKKNLNLLSMNLFDLLDAITGGKRKGKKDKKKK